MQRKQKHGMSRTRMYQCWADMKDRCNNPNNPFYFRYGGRGVRVCDNWINDFLCFYTWAIKNGYDSQLTLERINNDGDYKPSNCRWATQHEQSMNKKHLESKTGYVGVKDRGNGTFSAEITRYRKYYYVGTYKSPEQASEARTKFLEEKFGEVT